MIIIQNLTKRYGKILALDNVSFSFHDSRIIAIMGENGAGKSTLLKICANILPFDVGEILVDGISIKIDPTNYKKNLGYLPELPELYDRVTGREFLFYIASLRKLDGSEKKITHLARLIGIIDFLDYEIGGYSKGMKQKISMIAAIMHEPRNLLLDEPVYGLDPLTARTIQEFIKQRKGTTVIATHSTQLVEQVADEVYILQRGHVTHTGLVIDLLKEYGSIENLYFNCKKDETECLKPPVYLL